MYYTIESDTIKGVGTLYWADTEMLEFDRDIKNRMGEPFDGTAPEIRLSFDYRKSLRDFKHGVADFSTVDRLIVLSERAREVLDPLIAPNVEYLNVSGPVDNIVGVHVLEQLEPFAIRDHGIQALDNHGHLFTTQLSSPFIVTEEFKGVVEQHRLTNVFFQEFRSVYQVD